MSAGLRVYDPTTGKVMLETTDKITRIVGKLSGNGSVPLPDSTSDYFTFSSAITTDNPDPFVVAAVTVVIDTVAMTATVSNSADWIMTYVGVY